MSGAAIGTKPTTMPYLQIEIRKDRKKAREKLRAEVPGDTKSRFHDARHVLASRRNSATPIMAFGSFATGLAEHSDGDRSSQATLDSPSKTKGWAVEEYAQSRRCFAPEWSLIIPQIETMHQN
jgi:hypothetical protein